MNDPMIISIGEDFRDYPKRYWGSRDRAQAAREDAARAALRPVPKEWLPISPDPPAPSFSSFAAPPSRAETRRLGLQPRPDLDERLRKLGIRPRRPRW